MIPRQVKDWMVPNPITVGPQATVAEADALLEGHCIRHLPVMDKGRVTGIVSIGDIVKEVIAEQAVLIKVLEQYIRGSTET